MKSRSRVVAATEAGGAAGKGPPTAAGGRPEAAAAADAVGLLIGKYVRASERVSVCVCVCVNMTDMCTLMPGLEGLLVQGALFVLCCGVLVVKYSFEREGRRPFKDFVMDSSKQIVGAGLIHAMNMGLSVTTVGVGTECGWYVLHIVVDCTFGVCVEYFSLKLLVFAVSTCGDDSVETGNYRDHANAIVWSRYWKQLVLWLAAVFIMKVIVVLSLSLFGVYMIPPVESLVGSLPSTAQLPFVMIAAPMLMTVPQIVLTDCFLRKKVGDNGDGYYYRDPLTTRVSHRGS